VTDYTTIARPYAQAAFEQASEEAAIAEWSELLKLLGQVVADPQMQALLNNPRVNRQQLLEIVTGIGSSKLSATGMNFIKILISAGRLKHVARISTLFEQKWAVAEGRLEVNVTSAYELLPEQKNSIAEAMAKRLGKKINISSLVDQSLIGGMIVRAGDSVIDVSLRGQLNELRRTLIR
jgi:F-type H+-transporting ATPase subunit delta